MSRGGWDDRTASDVFARNGQGALHLGAPTKRSVPASIPGASQLTKVDLKPGEWFAFVVPMKPRSKERPRMVKNEGQAPRTITPHRTEEGEKIVRQYAQIAGCPKLSGWVELDVTLYVHDLARRDTDNMAKLVQDALNSRWEGKGDKRRCVRPGIAYEDDHQISDLSSRKRLDRENPRIVVRVRNRLDLTEDLRDKEGPSTTPSTAAPSGAATTRERP